MLSNLLTLLFVLKLVKKSLLFAPYFISNFSTNSSFCSIFLDVAHRFSLKPFYLNSSA